MSNRIFRAIAPPLLLATMGALWGLSPGLVKFALTSDVSKYDVLLIGIVGKAVLLTIILATKSRWFFFSFDRLRFFFLSGLIGVFIPFLVQVTTAPNLSVSLMVLIVSCTPLVAVAFAVIFRLEVVSRQRILGGWLGMLGVTIVILSSYGFPDIHGTAWVIYFSVPFSYATVQIFIVKYWPEDLDYLQVAAGESVVCAMLFLPVYLWAGDFEVVTSEWALDVYVVFLWVIFGIMAELIFYYLLKNRGAVYVSSGTFISIGSGYVWGLLIFEEEVVLAALVGTVILCGSLFLIASGENTCLEK